MRKDWLRQKTGRAMRCKPIETIDLDHDEGHADPDTDDLKQNHHAHIIVDGLNHETEKTVKIDSNVCKEMQTVLAESLGMERGTPK